MVLILSALWWIRTRGLWKLPNGRDWLRGKLGLVLIGRAMFSKSLIQFSFDGRCCVPSCYLTWGQIMVEVMNIMVISFNIWSTWEGNELLIVKFRLKLKKVGKTTRPFRYDLNQIPYDYTVEVTNRFKRLDVIDKVPKEPWTEVHGIVQEAEIKTMPKKKKCKKAKCLSEECLQIAEKRRESKGKGEKERYTHLNAELQRIARRDKKAFLSHQCKEIEGKK